MEPFKEYATNEYIAERSLGRFHFIRITDPATVAKQGGDPTANNYEASLYEVDAWDPYALDLAGDREEMKGAIAAGTDRAFAEGLYLCNVYAPLGDFYQKREDKLLAMATTFSEQIERSCRRYRTAMDDGKANAIGHSPRQYMRNGAKHPHPEELRTLLRATAVLRRYGDFEIMRKLIKATDYLQALATLAEVAP